MRSPTFPGTPPFLSIVLFAAGCSGNKDTGDSPPETAYVLSGFNHTWDKLSHRVSLAEVAIDADGEITSGIIGGDFSTGDVASDFVDVRVSQSKITGEGVYIGHGVVDVVVGPDGAFSETVTLEVPGISKAGMVTAAFGGFRIATDTAQGSDYPSDYDPALGYTTKGFGFAVGEPSLSGDTATLTVSGEVRWALTNNDTDPADRSDMNGAIPFAQTEVSLHYTVIGVDGSMETASGTGSVDYPNGFYSEQPPLSEADLGISLASDGTGFPVIRSFDLLLEDLHPDDGSVTEFGDYIRSYGIELAAASTVGVSTEVTNSSVIEIATIRFTPTAEVGWVQLSGDASVETIAADGAHEIGTVTFSPDDPPQYSNE